MRNVNIDDFVKVKGDTNQTMIASGRLYKRYDNTISIEINYTSIITKLIQEAGKYCSSYASDLVIDLNSLEEKMRDFSIETDSMLFGFRDLGVDSDSNIINSSCYTNRLDNSINYTYRSIWRLDLYVSEYDEELRTKNIKMTLYEVRLLDDKIHIDTPFGKIYAEVVYPELNTSAINIYLVPKEIEDRYINLGYFEIDKNQDIRSYLYTKYFEEDGEAYQTKWTHKDIENYNYDQRRKNRIYS